MIAHIALGLFVGLVAGLIVDRFRRTSDIASRIVVAVAVVAPVVALGYWLGSSAVGAFFGAMVASVLALAAVSQRSTSVNDEETPRPQLVGNQRSDDEMD